MRWDWNKKELCPSGDDDVRDKNSKKNAWDNNDDDGDNNNDDVAINNDDVHDTPNVWGIHDARDYNDMMMTERWSLAQNWT